MSSNREQAIVEIILKGQQPNATLKDIQQSARALSAQLKRLPVDSKEFADKSAELQKVNKRLKSIQDDVKGTSNVFADLARKVKSFGMGAVAALSFGWFTGQANAVVQSNAKMSDSFADIRKTTGMTAMEVKNFDNTLKQMDTRTAVEDLRSIAIVAGQLGIKKEDIVKFTDSVDKMVVSLGDEFTGGAEEVTKVMGGLRGVFTDIRTDKIDQDMLHIGNAINVLASEGAATGPVMADFANRIGGVGVTLGLTSAQVLGLSATLQELNVNAERGSTAVVKILQKMTTNVKDFAAVAGMDVQDFNHLVNNDLYGAFLKVVEGSKKGGTAATQFGKILKDLDVDGAGASEVIAKLGANTSMLSDKVKVAGSALKGTDSIMEEFRLKNETLGAELDRLSKNFSNYFNTSDLGDFFRGIVSGINNIFDNVPKVDRLSSAWREQKGVVDQLHDTLDPLLTRHDELKKKSSLTTSEQKELNDIILKVSKVVPYAATEFDKYGKAMDISTEKGRQFLKMEEQKLEVMNKDALKGYREEIIDVTKHITELQKALQMRDIQGDLYKVVYVQTRIGEESRYTTKSVKLTNEEIKKLQEELTIAQDKQLGLVGVLNELKGVAVQANKDVVDSNKKAANDTAYVDEELKAKLEKEAVRHHKQLVKEYEKYLKDIEELEVKHGEEILSEKDKEVSKVVWKYREMLDKQDEFLKNKVITQAEYDRNEAILLDLRHNEIGLIDEKYYKKSEKEYAEFEKNKRKLLNTDIQNEIDAVKDKYDEVIQLAIQNNQDITALESAKREAILAIEQKYKDKEKKAKDKSDNKDEQQKLNERQALYGEFYSAINAYQDYYAQKNKNIMDEALARYDKQSQKELDNQKSLLDQKLITQDQYDKNVEKINADYAKKEAAVKKREAEKEKQAAEFNVILDGIQAISNIWSKWAAVPYVAAGLTAGAVFETGLRLAAVQSTPIPEYAIGGFHNPNGFVNSETMFSSSSGQPFIAGEKGSEWIAPNWMLKNPVTANYIDVLESIRSTRSFAVGGNTGSSKNISVTSPSANFAELSRTIDQLSAVLASIESNGIEAYLNYDEFKKVNTSIDNAKSISAIS